MTKKDIVFAAICGLSVAWIASDFFSKYWLFFFIALPLLSVFGLWVADFLGRKFLFFRQLAKFALAGAFADVIDIKVFQLFFLFLPLPVFLKVISFLVATVVKYVSDKYWAFENFGKKDMHVEALKFLLVAVVGLIINVSSFWLFSRMETGIPLNLWLELSIIFAALVAAAWNFIGYKFIVFKR